MEIKTHLISGAGNTFHIVFDDQNQFAEKNLPESKKKDLTRTACAKDKADGFIFLQKKINYQWFFYNSDGSNAEMCGNATRCVGYYIKNILKDPGTRWTLQTQAGAIEIFYVEKEVFKIEMTPIHVLSSTHGIFFDTGVPHLIQEIAQFSDYRNLKQVASELRTHSDFKPRGTNVTYVKLANEVDRLQAVSFERGVEDFTDACGTGAMAAAMYNLIKRGSTQTQVEMPGGTLMMDLSDLKKPTMTGPAVLIGKFEYEISAN